MTSKLVIAAVVGLLFASAAQAAWRATGETRFEPLHTVYGSPGETVILKARLLKQVKNTQTNQTKWVPMVNCRVLWETKYYCPIRRGFHEGETRTNTNGVASIRATIKRSAVPYSYGAYVAIYPGRNRMKFCIRTGHLYINR